MKQKRKKNTRQHGLTTHGWGSMKKHRGSGNRGGKGNAGSGKRGDAKKPSYWADPKYYGKHGFASIQGTQCACWNIQQLEENYQKLLKQGVIKEQQGAWNIDLKSIGVDKLLGKGTPVRKWNITALYASASAVEKIKEKGGDVQLLRQGTEEATAEESE